MAGHAQVRCRLSRLVGSGMDDSYSREELLEISTMLGLHFDAKGRILSLFDGFNKDAYNRVR